MRDCLLIVALIAAPGLALSTQRPPALRRVVSRRDAVFAAAACAGLAAPSVRPAVANTPLVSDKLALLIVKARELRGNVRNGAAARRTFPLDPDPTVNNYSRLTDDVQRKKVKVLLPLQEELSAVADAFEGPEELKKQLQLQPQLLKGHLVELDQTLADFDFSESMLKSTGKVYQGGKVERELEEVEEVCDEFLAVLARARRG